MTSIIQGEMIKYLSNNNLMHHGQHEFHKLHSTGTQLLECLNDWTYSIGNHNVLISVTSTFLVRTIPSQSLN